MAAIFFFFNHPFSTHSLSPNRILSVRTRCTCVLEIGIHLLRRGTELSIFFESPTGTRTPVKYRRAVFRACEISDVRNSERRESSCSRNAALIRPWLSNDERETNPREPAMGWTTLARAGKKREGVRAGRAESREPEKSGSGFTPRSFGRRLIS